MTVRPLESLDEAVALLAPLHPATRAHRLVSQVAAPLVLAADLGSDHEVLQRLLCAAPGLTGILADRLAGEDVAAAALPLYRALPEGTSAAIWTRALRVAADANAAADAAFFATRLAGIPSMRVSDLREAAIAIAPADAESFWLRASAANRSGRIVPVALRGLYLIEKSPAFYEIALGAATGTLRGTIDAPTVIDAMRIFLARAWRWGDAPDLTAIMPDPALSADVLLWVRAILAWARFDYAEARALLDEGSSRWPESDAVSFAQERAVLATRFGRYGVVADDLVHVAAPLPLDAHHAPLRAAATIVAAARPAPGAHYPHYLIDAVFDRAPSPVYEPVPGSITTVVAALASGGSERQAVTLIEALSHDPRISRQDMLIRSVTPERRGFFLPQVEASNIPFHVFDSDPADVPAVLALLGDEPGSALSVALPLLPAQLRTTICQLVPMLIERKPAVVHIRQDFYAAALACVLAGVPRFFIHRGSLTPDHWHLTTPQRIATVAPMRHTYRRLIAWPGFGFINNAASGVRSDREWTGGDDPERFSLVHNIVDFAWLGASDDADDHVRRAIGAAPGDLVVGAAFRFHPVKRPLLWLAAARRILTRHPRARFLILGDGEMRAAMLAYAEAHGFADRLHLPGSIADLGPWYRAMDVALLTSDREGLPNMLIEAQHFGVIPVSTDVGGAAETMAVGATGILVPPDASAEVIGDAVAAAFDDRAWFARARAAAPAFVHARFGAKTAIDQLVALYGFADRSPL